MGQGELSQEDVDALMASIQRTPIATVVTDYRQPDNPIVAANAAFAALTGYDPLDIIGRNCRFLAGPGTEADGRAALRRAVEEGEPLVVELTNYRRDGSSFRNAVMIAPVRDGDGRVALFVGSQMDVSAVGAAGLRRERAREQVNRLTPRLRQVLELLAAGHRNKQIGARLGIEEKTVKMHRARLLDALGSKSSADAIRIAVEAEIVPVDRA